MALGLTHVFDEILTRLEIEFHPVLASIAPESQVIEREKAEVVLVE